MYNIFSYACAVVRANARSPLGFFELLLSLFLNKLVFLFVRTAVDLVANPVDEATGEYHQTFIDHKSNYVIVIVLDFYLPFFTRCKHFSLNNERVFPFHVFDDYRVKFF